MTIRSVAYIDGFNLYHAISDLGCNHLKWVDLWKLCSEFVASKDELQRVLYFSAFAYWLPTAEARHREYVAALRASGVEPMIGRFKERDRNCRTCGASWKHHEEKETDVSIGTRLLDGA